MPQLLEPRVSPAGRTVLAALLVAALALAGCGRPAADGMAAPATTAQPPAPTTAPAGPIRLGDAPAYVALAATDVTVFARPRDARVVAVFPAKLPWGSPTTFLVRRAHRDSAGDTWVNVLLPRRPNGSSGWIRHQQVRLRPVAHEVQIDLSARTARLLRDRRTVGTWPVGIGQADTPTPTGRFYITVKLRPPQISRVYGAWALGLSGYSDVLEQFGTGDGQIALHGTTNPTDLGQEVSNGCVRMSNPAITTLATTLPLGTPVTITA